MYQFEVVFIDDNGKKKRKVVQARHEFEAVQLAGAFGKQIVSVINLDL